MKPTPAAFFYGKGLGSVEYVPVGIHGARNLVVLPVVGQMLIVVDGPTDGFST